MDAQQPAVERGGDFVAGLQYPEVLPGKYRRLHAVLEGHLGQVQHEAIRHTGHLKHLAVGILEAVGVGPVEDQLRLPGTELRLGAHRHVDDKEREGRVGQHQNLIEARTGLVVVKSLHDEIGLYEDLEGIQASRPGKIGPDLGAQPLRQRGPQIDAETPDGGDRLTVVVDEAHLELHEAAQSRRRGRLARSLVFAAPRAPPGSHYIRNLDRTFE